MYLKPMALRSAELGAEKMLPGPPPTFTRKVTTPLLANPRPPACCSPLFYSFEWLLDMYVYASRWLPLRLTGKLLCTVKGWVGSMEACWGWHCAIICPLFLTPPNLVPACTYGHLERTCLIKSLNETAALTQFKRAKVPTNWLSQSSWMR